HFEALSQGIPPLPRSEVLSIRKTLRGRLHLFLPVIALISLFSMGYSAVWAGLWSLVTALVVWALRPHDRLTVRKFIEVVERGGRTALPVIIACASVGIVVGSTSLTGLGIKFASLILSLSQGQPFLALLITMVASLILGLGLPTTPTYIITTAITA